MKSLELAGGLFFCALGLGYLYRPDLVERLYRLVRESIFNDAHFALERRKWGLFFLLMGALFLYFGVLRPAR